MASTLSKSVNGACEMRDTDAAYFAGFVDGEGTISLARAKRRGGRIGVRYRPYLSVANTNLDVLVGLQNQCGNGRVINKFTTTRVSPMRRDLFALDLGAEQMRRVLPVLLPHLRIKSRQAQLLCEFLDISVRGRQLSDAEWNRVGEIYIALRRLNARGTDALPLGVPHVVKPARWKNQWGAEGTRGNAVTTEH